jgi:hypothetical protein
MSSVGTVDVYRLLNIQVAIFIPEVWELLDAQTRK